MQETSPGAEPRRANLGDAMILTAAVGVGIALAVRPLSDIHQWSAMIRPTSGSAAWMDWWADVARKRGPRFQIVQGVILLGICFIAPLTPALLVARLRRPRPAFRSLACQPGLVASAALCLVTVVEVDVAFLQLVRVPPLLEMAAPGAAVLASWLTLAAAGRWRPEASWVDRAGRLVGAFWIATIPWLTWQRF